MRLPIRGLLVYALIAAAPVLGPGNASAQQTVLSGDHSVEGSLCVGVDCTNTETYGFSLLRLKANNARIDFVDTSNSASFAKRDWRLQANGRENGDPEYFAIIDLGDDDLGGADVTDRSLFVLQAGAPHNSVVVASSGHVGLGTDTPDRDLNLYSSDTPTIRLEQEPHDFPEAIWDISANDKALIVKEVSNDNSRPFRIKAGAPSSSIEIARNGRVGIGVGKPRADLHVDGTVKLRDVAGCAAGIRSSNNGKLSCITSSRRFKIVTGDLLPDVALANVMALRPQVGAYKQTPDVPEHWLIAEEAAEVDPAFVGLRNDEPYTVKMQNVVADLITVVQQQQRRIDALERELAR